MTPYERSRIAQDLRAHVRDHPSGVYAAYLTELADLYDTNAALSAQGKPILWPPWHHIPNTPFGLGVLAKPKPQPTETRRAATQQTAAEFDAGFFADDGRE